MTGATLAQEARQREETLHRRAPAVWAATLLGPLAANGVIVGWLIWSAGWTYTLKCVGTAAATFFFFGRFIILGGSEPGVAAASAFFSRVELVALVLWIDLCVAVVLTFHGGIVYRVPVLGRRLERLAGDAEYVLARHPRMRRFALAGLIVFNTVPHVLSGSVFGSLLGRLTGLTPGRTLVGLIAGSLAGNTVMFFGAGLINRLGLIDRDNPWNFVVGLGMIVGLIAVLDWRFAYLRTKWERREGRGAAQADAAREA